MQIHNNFATSLFLFFSVPFFLSLVRDERDLIYESPPHGAPASAEHRYHTHALFSSTYSSLPSTWPGVRPGRKASSSILFISDNLTRPILQPTQSIYSCQPSLSPFLSDPPRLFFFYLAPFPNCEQIHPTILPRRLCSSCQPPTIVIVVVVIICRKAYTG